MTYTSYLKILQLIIDLLFAISEITKNIIDWTINDKIVTKSNHEVIEFNLVSKNAKNIDSLLNALYMFKKRIEIFFIQNLQLNYAFTKLKMQKLI